MSLALGSVTPPAAILCGHIRWNGQHCRRHVRIAGGKCDLHGGGHLASRIKAEATLAAARIPACEALFRIIEQWESATCATCGFPTGDGDMIRTIVKTCQVILDRTGLGPHAVFELTKQSDGDFQYALLTREERAEMATALDTVHRLKEAVRGRQQIPDQVRPVGQILEGHLS